MADVWFYHLDRSSLIEVLPPLLERSIARGWKAVVQSASAERVEALDAALWTFEEASFLPHGTARDGDAALQPVLLTTGTENPNGAQVRFLVDGADAHDALAHEDAGYERVVVLFDGNDEDAREAARAQWRALKAQAHAVTYHQQDEDGRWARRG